MAFFRFDVRMDLVRFGGCFYVDFLLAVSFVNFERRGMVLGCFGRVLGVFCGVFLIIETVCFRSTQQHFQQSLESSSNIILRIIFD